MGVHTCQGQFALLQVNVAYLGYSRALTNTGVYSVLVLVTLYTFGSVCYVYDVTQKCVL